MEKKGLSERERYILVATGIVIILAFFYQFALSPFIDHYSKMGKEIITVQKRIFKYHQYQKNLSVPSGSGSALKFFKESSDILSSIETIAHENNVEVLEIRPDAESVKQLKSFKQILINLRIRGQADKVSGFIFELDQPLSSFRIERLSIGSQIGSNNLDASFIVSVFYSPYSP